MAHHTQYPFLISTEPETQAQAIRAELRTARAVLAKSLVANERLMTESKTAVHGTDKLRFTGHVDATPSREHQLKAELSAALQQAGAHELERQHLQKQLEAVRSRLCAPSPQSPVALSDHTVTPMASTPAEMPRPALSLHETCSFAQGGRLLVASEQRLTSMLRMNKMMDEGMARAEHAVAQLNRANECNAVLEAELCSRKPVSTLRVGSDFKLYGLNHLPLQKDRRAREVRSKDPARQPYLPTPISLPRPS